MVGNGVTTWKYDTTPAFVEMAYWFGITDDTLYHNIKDNCNLEYYGFDAPLSDECQAWMASFDILTANVNVYDLFGKCYTAPKEPTPYSSAKSFL